MNKFSTGITKTEYIDPVAYIQNQRCRFELDGSKLAYLPNMRLLDLGCSSNVATPYNRGLGVVSLIKNIRLLDARTELSSLRTVAPYMLFKSTNHTNSENKSVKSWLQRNNMGHETSAINAEQAHIYPSGDAGATVAASKSGIIRLDEMLPFLKDVGVLPTSLFKNLVLEIEFNANPLDQILTKNNSEINTLRPVLAVDYIDNQNAVEPLTAQLMQNGVRWLEIETDNGSMPEVDVSGFGATEIDKTLDNINSLGFLDKNVERILITKQLLDKTQTVDGANNVLGYGLPSSFANLQQALQIRLNGRNILPGFRGVKGDNARLGLMCDTWGAMSMMPGSNFYQWDQAFNLYQEGRVGGQQDYFGMLLGAKVANLQIQIERETNADTSVTRPTNSAQTVNIYGEVHKALTIRPDGSYRIQYV
tara:strand:- start:944 stop:2203 length:1260 start_codon:yes stop_codon:yes gene_type:complete